MTLRVETDELQSDGRFGPDGVLQEIAPGERMPHANRKHYFRVGRDAVRLIRMGLRNSGKTDEEVGHVLDMACGHGRVTRALRAAFPDARLTVCDLLADGVEFCAEKFDAVGVQSRRHPTAELFPDAGAYDVIFVGSLLTHLDAPDWRPFLQLFARLLAPGGLLVLTTHGPYVAQRMAGGFNYGYDFHMRRRWRVLQGVLGHFGLRTPARWVRRAVDPLPYILRDYRRTGFGYLDDGSGCYGITVTSPAWVLGQVARFTELRTVGYLERGWDQHQDVVLLHQAAFPPEPR